MYYMIKKYQKMSFVWKRLGPHGEHLKGYQELLVAAVCPQTALALGSGYKGNIL